MCSVAVVLLLVVTSQTGSARHQLDNPVQPAKASPLCQEAGHVGQDGKPAKILLVSLLRAPWELNNLTQRWAATLNYATQPLSRVATAATLRYATLQRF
ncbi:hypothetical protein PCASD_24419 [Puccinia coronata f. sp. avenae]|uniref:Uncharacterized protein n=1 Tax=Puccinia coronata f. sp. avenae TaxID=200324 RepID=A0A2N5TIA2_9BASI|nr:hypothetical protein PCASD_24419 [Puccinia coronata f. sp. avenae]